MKKIVEESPLSEKKIPIDWEYNIVILIHKKYIERAYFNNRPICLSPVLEKQYLSMLENRLRLLAEPTLGMHKKVSDVEGKNRTIYMNNITSELFYKKA